jgi:hypothetical protein
MLQRSKGWKRPYPISIERNADMREPDFWTSYAEAMEMSIEGNRLIAREVGDLIRGLWQRSVRSLDGMIRGSGQHRHLPPI